MERWPIVRWLTPRRPSVAQSEPMATKVANPPLDILGELVDQFAPVRQQVDDFRPTQNLHDKLWKQIKTHVAGHPGNKSITLKGNHYEIELDACQMERTVIAKPTVFEKLKKLFGAKRFWELVSFPVTPIDAMFSRDDEQTKNFIETTQTGYRKIVSITALDGPAKVAKAA